MNYWRMAMKIGNQGPNQWPDCYQRGIAAIGYHFEEEPVVEDCRKITEEEFDRIWKSKRPLAGPARNSLKNLAYRMKNNDIIYVKDGTRIVGKGIIVEEYDYNPNILEGARETWEHYVKVDWYNDFKSIDIQLGAEPHTVLKLEGDRLIKLQEFEENISKKINDREFKEGELYKSETNFRKRNRGLIELKKSQSNYQCEICQMSFKEKYGEIGKNFIIAHHIIPISKSIVSTKTKLDDIALVCANCHNMLHRNNPPYSILEMKKIYQV